MHACGIGTTIAWISLSITKVLDAMVLNVCWSNMVLNMFIVYLSNVRPQLGFAGGCMMHRLPRDIQLALRAWLNEGVFCKWLPGFEAQKGPTTFAMCAGTDSPILGVHSIKRAAAEVFDVDWSFEHLWSSELNATKRNFLARMFGEENLPEIYGDCSDLLYTIAREHRSGADRVPRKDGNVGYAGFPCTDVSGLNPRSNFQEHLTIVLNGGKSTGKVFQNQVAYSKDNELGGPLAPGNGLQRRFSKKRKTKKNN